MKNIILALLAFPWIPAAAAAPKLCTRPLACVECSLTHADLSDIKEDFLLYWDACQGPQSASPILYYLPNSIEPLIKDGRQLILLREQSDGSLLISGKMGFYPWSMESDANGIPFLNKLKTRYRNLRLAPITPKTYEIKLHGQWSSWLKSQKLFSISGLDFNQPLPITLVFREDSVKLAREAFKRPGGLMGSLQFTYEIYNERGEIVEVKHNIPFHLHDNAQP